MHLNNSVYVVKTDNDRRYMGLVVTRNKIIKLLHEGTKKGDLAGISLNLYAFLFCIFDNVFTLCFRNVFVVVYSI